MELLSTGPEEASAELLLAHGAGAPMDSSWMNAMADALAGAGMRVHRFEFEYMADRRIGKRTARPQDNCGAGPWDESDEGQDLGRSPRGER